MSDFFGLQQLEPSTHSMMKKFLAYSITLSGLEAFYGLVFILYLIDSQGFVVAGQITAIRLTTQLIIDYPSGTLGDYIGQRSVLGGAVVLSGLGLVTFSFAISFNQFTISAIILGMADAFASGALFSWLDTNYKYLSKDSDPGNLHLGFTKSRISSVTNVIRGLMIILGGYTAVWFDRVSVFRISATCNLIIGITIILTMFDYFDTNSLNPQEGEVLSYLQVIIGGLKFIFSKLSTFLFIFGYALYRAMWGIWFAFLLYPIYFGYTGTDAYASLFRSSLFFTGILLSVPVATITRKIPNRKVGGLMYIRTFVLLILTAAVLYVIPPSDKLNYTGIIFIFIIFSIGTSILGTMSNTMLNRKIVDIVPSEFRNSIYSLIPSIVAIINIILLPLVGLQVEHRGLYFGVELVSILGFMGTTLIVLSDIKKFSRKHTGSSGSNFN